MKEASKPFAWLVLEWLFAGDVKVPKDAPVERVPVEEIGWEGEIEG